MRASIHPFLPIVFRLQREGFLDLSRLEILEVSLGFGSGSGGEDLDEEE